MEQVKTADGSITFRSDNVDETYHSTSGAREESMKKFVEPCIDFIEGKDEITVLDVCFGLGYNTAALLDKYKGKINVIALENDPEILLKILEVDDAVFGSYKIIKELIKENVERINEIKENIKENEMKNNESKNKENKEELNEINNKSKNINNENIKEKTININENKEINQNNNNNNNTKETNSKTTITITKNNIKITIIIDDARQSIKQIKDKFDICFLDPFSPKKCPELWSYEFLNDIYDKMSADSVITTYSCARVVRDNLRKAGFLVRDGPCVGRRSPSTVSVKCGPQ